MQRQRAVHNQNNPTTLVRLLTGPGQHEQASNLGGRGQCHVSSRHALRRELRAYNPIMTATEFEDVVKDCVADWFGRCKALARSTRPDAIAEAQKESRLLKAIQKNELMYDHLLRGDEKHAKDAVNA